MRWTPEVPPAYSRNYLGMLHQSSKDLSFWRPRQYLYGSPFTGLLSGSEGFEGVGFSSDGIYYFTPRESTGGLFPEYGDPEPRQFFREVLIFPAPSPSSDSMDDGILDDVRDALRDALD